MARLAVGRGASGTGADTEVGLLELDQECGRLALLLAARRPRFAGWGEYGPGGPDRGIHHRGTQKRGQDEDEAQELGEASR